MRVAVAFLEFLEGKHRIHVNPFNYTSLLTICWASCTASLSSLIAVGPCTQHPREQTQGLCFPLCGRTQVREPCCLAPRGFLRSLCPVSGVRLLRTINVQLKGPTSVCSCVLEADGSELGSLLHA